MAKGNVQQNWVRLLSGARHQFDVGALGVPVGMGEIIMKVFVRCVQSKMYFTEAGNWTEKKWEGQDFQTTLHVLDDPKLHLLNEDLEMVYSFGEAKFDVVIPIGHSS